MLGSGKSKHCLANLDQISVRRICENVRENNYSDQS